MAFSFSMSLMFIFMPPGIMMSPGFWSALQAPSHFASIVVVESRGAPAGPRSDVRGRLHRIGGIEVAGDFGMRGDRHAGDAADGIADITGRGLLDILLGAHLLAPSARLRCSFPCRWSRRCSAASSSSGIGEPVRSTFISHRPGLADRQVHRAGIARRQQRQQAEAPNQMTEAVASWPRRLPVDDPAWTDLRRQSVALSRACAAAAALAP